MSKRLLLCDDELHILRAAEFKLTRGGYDVLCAHDGIEAWELVRLQVPDMVITDLQMPGLNGFELIRKIRGCEQTRHIPIVMLTAKRYELAEGDLAAELDVVRVLTKPFSPRELLQLVDATLSPNPSQAAGPAG